MGFCWSKVLGKNVQAGLSEPQARWCSQLGQCLDISEICASHRSHYVRPIENYQIVPGARWGRSNEVLKLWGESTNEKMAVEMTMKWKNPCTVHWMNQWTKDSTSQWISGSLNHHIKKTMNQWIAKSMNQWTNDSTSQTNQWNMKQLKQQINESMLHRLNEPMIERAREPVNQQLPDQWITA